MTGAPFRKDQYVLCSRQVTLRDGSKLRIHYFRNVTGRAQPAEYQLRESKYPVDWALDHARLLALFYGAQRAAEIAVRCMADANGLTPDQAEPYINLIRAEIER